MIKGIDAILLSSENAQKLADFYKNIIGLKVKYEFEMGDDKEAVIGFEMGTSSDFVIMDHSKVKGRNNNPERMIINFEVDNIENEVKRLDKNNVKKIQDIYHIEEYGLVATFEDLDGNYFQLVQIRES